MYPCQDVVRLGGVPRRGLVGFLTLQEAYGYYEVGDYYKSPQVPVWVVYSESHYSVLFSTEARLLDGERKAPCGVEECVSQAAGTSQAFDLYYWDMLANQDETIRMTVTPSQKDDELPDIDDKYSLIPPLDLVIRTKWPGHVVNWNGTDAIL